jgi:hypothetical protein
MALGETMLDLLKTLAGPIATVFASVTAGGVAVWFGRVQADIARRQAATAAAQKEIAFDKLKHDLFDKRYEIYQAAKAVIEAVFNKSPVDPADPECRFFFPPDTRAFCENIENQVYAVLTASRAASGYSEDRPERYELREKQSNAEIELADIYGQLAKRFERDLGFEQLTNRSDERRASAQRRGRPQFNPGCEIAKS